MFTFSRLSLYVVPHSRLNEIERKNSNIQEQCINHSVGNLVQYNLIYNSPRFQNVPPILLGNDLVIFIYQTSVGVIENYPKPLIKTPIRVIKPI